MIEPFACIVSFVKKTGVFNSKNTIKKLVIKLGEYSGHYLTFLACLDKLKIVWNEYGVAKKEACALQQTFLEDKIARKAHDRNVTTENMAKMTKQEQQSIQEGIDLIQIRGRNNKHPVLKAEITDFITGITPIIYT